MLKNNKFILIDRDGVINKDPGGWTEHSYVTKWEDFYFLPGAIEALRILKENGIKVVVVSNQAGVGKNYFSEKDLKRVNSLMMKEVEKGGGKIEEVYYCIHRDEDACDCRKPKTGLFEKAAKKYGIDLKGTYIVGDSDVDIEAGRRLGMKTIFVLSGKVSKEEIEKWEEKPDYVFNDLLEAVNRIIDKGTI